MRALASHFSCFQPNTNTADIQDTKSYCPYPAGKFVHLFSIPIIDIFFRNRYDLNSDGNENPTLNRDVKGNVLATEASCTRKLYTSSVRLSIRVICTPILVK